MGKQYRKSGDTDNELGKVIRTRMRRLKLSRDGLAELLGVDPTYISQLFRYEHQLRYTTALLLAKALEIPVGRIETANRSTLRRLRVVKK